jgi:hypothetical protein
MSGADGRVSELSPQYELRKAARKSADSFVRVARLHWSATRGQGCPRSFCSRILWDLTTAVLAWLCFTLSPAPLAVAETVRYQAPATHRLGQTINRDWTFNYFPAENADHAGCQAPGFDDSTWPAIAVPHTWQTYETTGKLHPFIRDASEKEDPYWWYGWGWYRKHFSIAKDQAGRKVFVEFDGVQKYCQVWINGKLAGDHKGGYSGFEFDITDFVRLGEDNVLAVAVNNRQNDPYNIPPMSAGNWNTYGGIYRDVRLVLKDRLFVPYQGSCRHEGGTFVTTPEVSAASAKTRVRTWVQNDYPMPKECELRTVIADAEGNIVQLMSDLKTIAPGQLAEFEQTTPAIAHPHLWSPETPYLYTVSSDVYDATPDASNDDSRITNHALVAPKADEGGSRITDHFESPLGFRQFKWDYDQNRLILNGQKVIIHGSNRHQEYPWLGDATPKWLHLADMRDFRFNLNHNFMRTAHYPNDPCIYDFCDRNGIIVIEELPNDKRQEFSQEVQVQQLREMIRRDRNHPAILFWSMGNETDHAADSKFAIEEDTTRILHAREIYNDSAGKYVTHTQKQLALESLLRCTIRGWYNADVRPLEPESAQQAGHETWQHDLAAAEIIKRNQGRTRDDMANLNTWIYEDHGCNRDYANAPLRFENPKGFVDCWRTPKYYYYLWQAVYADKPMVFVHPHFWRSQYVGQKREIVVDSNCDSVELLVNGKPIGTLKPQFDQANVLRFKEVQIEKGALTAVGKRGNQIVRAQIVMAGPAVRLALSCATPGSAGMLAGDWSPGCDAGKDAGAPGPADLEAGLDSVGLVCADIVDAQGHHVYGATNALQWSLSGPATLVGAPVYSTDTAKQEAKEGTMYIDAPAFNIIRSTGVAGQIKVRVRSPGLAPAEVVITAHAAPLKPELAVLEPALPKGDRQPVLHEGGGGKGPEVGLQEMKGVSEDLVLDAASLDGYTRQVDRFLRDKNPAIEFSSPEYLNVVLAFGRLLENNRGSLVRDDFNFTVGLYNDCRAITRQIDNLKSPAIFKRSLREYYARTIIEEGQARDCGAETRWLESLPQGQVVVAGAAPGPEREPGVLYASAPDLEAMVTLALPEFKTVSGGSKAALLQALCGINPNIQRRVAKSGGKKVNGVRQKTVETVTYQVSAGQPILVPSLKELQRLAAKQANDDTQADRSIAGR